MRAHFEEDTIYVGRLPIDHNSIWSFPLMPRSVWIDGAVKGKTPYFVYVYNDVLVGIDNEDRAE